MSVVRPERVKNRDVFGLSPFNQKRVETAFLGSWNIEKAQRAGILHCGFLTRKFLLPNKPIYAVSTHIWFVQRDIQISMLCNESGYGAY
jgi:hypothetical protein